MEGAVSTGMETVGTVVTEVIGYMGEIVSTITSQPLLLIPVGIGLVGAAIGLASRLIGR